MRSTFAHVALSALFAIMGAASASAVDLWPTADTDLRAYKWSGFSVAPYFGYERLRLNGDGSRALEDPNGWRVGGELDYDWQFGNLVLGLSGEGYYTWYEGNGRTLPELSARMTDYGTFRGKVGYATGRWLFYAAGGYAVADMTIKDGSKGLSDSNVLNGWTVGGGLEWVWNDCMTLRAEVDHMAFSSQNFTAITTGPQDVGADLDLFKIDFISRF